MGTGDPSSPVTYPPRHLNDVSPKRDSKFLAERCSKFPAEHHNKFPPKFLLKYPAGGVVDYSIERRLL